MHPDRPPKSQYLNTHKYKALILVTFTPLSRPTVRNNIEFCSFAISLPVNILSVNTIISDTTHLFSFLKNHFYIFFLDVHFTFILSTWWERAWCGQSFYLVRDLVFVPRVSSHGGGQWLDCSRSPSLSLKFWFYTLGGGGCCCYSFHSP